MRTGARGAALTLLRRYLPRRGAQLWLLAMLLLLGTALHVAGPLLQRWLIDAALGRRPADHITLVAMLALLIALAAQGADVAEALAAERMGWTLTDALRSDLTAHCLRLPARFHKGHPPGMMIERIDGDASQLAGFFGRFVHTVIGNGLLLVGVLGVLFWTDRRVGAALLAISAAALAGMFLAQRCARPLWRETRAASAEMFGFLEDRLTGAEEIHANGARADTLRRLEELGGTVSRTGRRAWVVGSIPFNIGQLYAAGTRAAVLGIGAYLYLREGASPGTIYSLFIYALRLTAPLGQLASQAQQLQKAEASAGRILELFETAPMDVCPPGEGIRGPTFPRGIGVRVEGLGFAYDPGSPVLRDVSLTIGAGRVVGLLGRTGSGKSTLARLIAGTYAPDAGEVRWADPDGGMIRRDGVRRRVGVVPQEVALFTATLRDNLTLFDPGVPDERLWEALTSLGLADWARALPEGLGTTIRAAELSAGEAQMIALARVLVPEPDLIILDEASAYLDPDTEARVGRSIDALLAGRTGIIIAHRLTTLRRVDEIVLLDGGEIVEQGPRAALAADPGSRFARLLANSAVRIDTPDRPAGEEMPYGA